MSQVGIGISVPPFGGGVIYDPAALTVFAAFTTPPTDTRKQLINSLIVSLKGAGLWGRLDCLHVYAAADSQAALINWVTPGTFNAALGNSGGANPTFTADRGFTTDGTGNFVDTGFNPGAGTPKFTLNDNSGGFWQLANVTNTNAGLGWTVTNGWLIAPRNSSNQNLSRNWTASSGTLSGVTDSSQLQSLERTDSTHNRVLNKGVSLGTPNTTSVSLNSADLMVGHGSAASFAAISVCADFFGQSLPGTANHLIMQNALLAYMQGVGAA